jgi:hypothetical protein
MVLEVQPITFCATCEPIITLNLKWVQGVSICFGTTYVLDHSPDTLYLKKEAVFTLTDIMEVY